MLLPGSAAATCTEDWRYLGEGLMSLGLTRELPAGIGRELSDGRCRVSGVRVNHGSKSWTEVGSITWRKDDLGPAIANRTFPHALRLQIRDMQLRSNFGDAKRNRQLGGLWNDDTPPADIDLDWDWNAEARQLRLEALRIAFATGDRVAMTGLFDNVDFSTTATTQMSITGWEAPSFTLTADLWDFLAGEFARATRKSSAKELSEVIASFPKENFADGALAALARMVDRKDDLRGRVNASFEAEPGLGPVRLMPMGFAIWRGDGFSDFWVAMQGVVFDVSYAPR